MYSSSPVAGTWSLIHSEIVSRAGFQGIPFCLRQEGKRQLIVHWTFCLPDESVQFAVVSGIDFDYGVEGLSVGKVSSSQSWNLVP